MNWMALLKAVVAAVLVIGIPTLLVWSIKFYPQLIPFVVIGLPMALLVVLFYFGFDE